MNLGRMLLLFDKNYERYIKQTSPRQFLILINDSDLREIDLHETSKAATLREQTFVLHGTNCLMLF